jgi:hypothetical protein
MSSFRFWGGSANVKPYIRSFEYKISFYLLLYSVISCYRYMKLFGDFGGETKDLQTAKQYGDSFRSFRITTYLKWGVGALPTITNDPNYKLAKLILSQEREFTLEDILRGLQKEQVQWDEKLLKKKLDKLRDNRIIVERSSCYSLDLKDL